MANRSIFAREMGKNDMIGIIIIAIFTIIVGIYNIWLSVDELQYLNGDEYTEIIGYAEEILDDSDDYSRDVVEQCESLIKIDSFVRVIDPIDIVLYAGIVAMGVLMLLRVRPSFLISAILYVLATITYVTYVIFSLIHGGLDYATESLEGSIFVVILRIGVLKMLISMAISAHAAANAPSQPVYVAPVGNVPLTPVERTNSSIDPVTGQQTASTMPAMLQKQPTQAAQAVHSSSMMQSVSAPSVPQPVARPDQTGNATATAQPTEQAADWQCRGCGFMNTAKSSVCAFCGTPKN